METTLKSAPVWIVPEGPVVHSVTALGSAGSVSLRGADSPSPIKRAIPGGETREYRIPNLARACQVLRLFASSCDSFSSSAVARQLKMPRTTVLRILHTLAAERLLQRRGFDFTASPELHTGLRSIADTALRAAAVPVLNEISQLTGETACLALLAGDKVAVVETCDSPYAARVGSGLRRVDGLALHCLREGVSGFWTAGLSGDGAGRWATAGTNPRTMTNAEALATECSRIVRQGYALDNEEYEEGVRCLAAPVWGSGGVLAAAIGVWASAATFTEQRASDVAPLVLQAAKKLTATLAQQTSR